jgi:hypothetical protein
MTFKEFMEWLVNSGGAIVVVSWIFERLPWFQGLTATAKEYVFFGACAVVAVLGYVGLTYIPPEVIQTIAPYFGILYMTFSAVFLGNLFHKADKK